VLWYSRVRKERGRLERAGGKRCKDRRTAQLKRFPEKKSRTDKRIRKKYVGKETTRKKLGQGQVMTVCRER